MKSHLNVQTKPHMTNSSMKSAGQGGSNLLANYFTNWPKKVCCQMVQMLSHITSSSMGFVKKGSWKTQMICYRIWKKKVLLPM
ncbi:hypothetical protein LWI29_036162 [Acer saccharum]|uniref:Uncharacterized protein n=1 Tax=Acer saccharum TaxID=4024 RepID=A0AA39TK25_ACESA|nr:hypothetical protein LWI29_036162 [Acer saccharum]